MPNDEALRKQLIQFMDWGDAHARFDAAVRDFPPALRGTRPAEGLHSPWELLEHLRLAQWDILEFTRNPAHVSPPFPEGYWPASEAPPDDAAWDASVAAFQSDLRAFASLVDDESLDLCAPIPHADGKPFLRELLLAADHNAYHLGQFLLIRRLLGAWA